MKAIETVYNGYRFRSRLETRWAVFFDVLGVEYDYEPEGFELDDGTKYLPDFRVKCYGTRGDRGPEHPAQIPEEPFDLYIEVKGEMTEADAQKIYAFSNEYHGLRDEIKLPVLIVGRIPTVRIPHDCCDSYIMESYDQMNGIDIYPFNYYTIDGDYFAAYPAATKDGRFYLMGDDSNYINDDDLERVMKAYQAARRARFEFNR